MDQKCWACDFLDFLNVLKSVLDKILEDSSRLVLSNGSDAFEAAHEEQAPWLPDTGDMSCRTTAHAPSKDYDVLFFNAKDFVDVIINVYRIIQNVFFV